LWFAPASGDAGSDSSTLSNERKWALLVRFFTVGLLWCDAAICFCCSASSALSVVGVDVGDAGVVVLPFFWLAVADFAGVSPVRGVGAALAPIRGEAMLLGGAFFARSASFRGSPIARGDTTRAGCARIASARPEGSERGNPGWAPLWVGDARYVGGNEDAGVSRADESESSMWRQYATCDE
jgi:hypothetical protein